MAVPYPVPVSISTTPVQYKDVNGVRLAYWEWGSGQPILLIEGFGGTVANATPLQASWNETFLSILSSKYHVYAYDHRGMGYSSTDNGRPRFTCTLTMPQGSLKRSGMTACTCTGNPWGLRPPSSWPSIIPNA